MFTRLWSNNNVKSTKAGEVFYEFLEEENLYQLVRGVTTNVSGTCLDLIIVESTSFVPDIAVRPPLDRSDHNFIEFKIQILSSKEKIKRTVYDYNAVDWEKQYEKAAEEFKAACITTKEDYYKKINSRVCASSKNWWSLVKNTLGRTRTTVIPALLNSMNKIVVDTREKIETLNEYFAEVCTWRGPIIDSKIADCLPESKVSINKFTVVQPEVEKILRSLDHNRACAPEITNRMIKNMAPSIVKSVCKLIYESFETSVFPEI
ncbi:unnamed protein product [Didymodactylos carnosus]|uniref:Uncharacterized protein n=1 Tax=Didymodactylos carnosus TaxID=1234261 RepID=A0A814PAM2_9BILA|nr:unnamed protein product [Didymodactylos carnosus]CAF3866048.1 unnamed protein product [Didymodactylos carnosus]